MEKRIIYADNAATTQVSKPVLEAMLPYLTGQYGNPSSIYALGRHAQRDIELARQQVAEALGCEPGEIFFTGCGPEGDNRAGKGPAVTKVCANSCIACGMCERTCKFDAIHVVDGVARVDYDKCKGCGMCAQKCPKKIILFPLKDNPYPPEPKKPAAAPAAAPAPKAEEKPAAEKAE